MKTPNKENLNKLCIIIHKILNNKNLLIITKCVAEANSFLVIDATLASDNTLRFR